MTAAGMDPNVFAVVGMTALFLSLLVLAGLFVAHAGAQARLLDDEEEPATLPIDVTLDELDAKEVTDPPEAA